MWQICWFNYFNNQETLESDISNISLGILYTEKKVISLSAMFIFVVDAYVLYVSQVCSIRTKDENKIYIIDNNKEISKWKKKKTILEFLLWIYSLKETKLNLSFLIFCKDDYETEEKTGQWRNKITPLGISVK